MKIPAWSDLSVRTRLTVGNVVLLALILVVLGTLMRYVAGVYLARVIDRELAGRSLRFSRRPPWMRDMPRAGRAPGRPEGRGWMPPGPPPPDEPDAPRPGRSREPSSARPGGGVNLFVNGPRDNRPRFIPRLMDLKRKNPMTREVEVPWDVAAFDRSARGERLFLTVSQGGERYRVFSTPVRDEDRIVGVFQVAHPLSEMNRELGRLSSILWIVFPLALLASGAGGYFLTARALQPVRALTRAAGGIQARNLSERLPVTGRDEFSVLAATFNGLLGRLEQAFERQRRFTADASHELRTPLAAIKGDVSLALSQQRSAPEYRQTLESVNEASDRMGRIVQDLLFLARSEGDRLPMDLQLVAMGDILRRAVSHVSAREHPPIRMDDVASGLNVVGDPHHLERLILNLLDNAVRHTPATGEIVLTARASGDKVVVTVADNGEGIAAEHLPHLFESFYRVDAARARAHGGTGLGLAICKSIVEAHRGTIDIASAPGEGATVTITLPAARMTDSGDEA